MDKSGFRSRLRRLRDCRPLKRAAGCVALTLFAHPAFAYRPFDSTDAAVAAQGEIEIECGPVGYAVEGPGRFVIVPAAIFNLGLPSRWEVVIEGKNFLQLNAPPQTGRQQVQDAAVSVKRVLRAGTLQDQQGASVAFEASLLFPTAPGERRLGSAITGIVSQQWTRVTLHVNEVLILTQDHQWTTVSGVILEGPSQWHVRPVTELTVEPSGHVLTTLAGGILTVTEHLALDAGFRWATSPEAHGREFRAGFAWGFATRHTSQPSEPSFEGGRRSGA